MKKRGFTLSELMITMTIVGVASALIVPAVQNIMPDKRKMLYMQKYTELVKVTQEIINDEELYYLNYARNLSDNTWEATCQGLSCPGTPTKNGYTSSLYSGSNKYKNILAKKIANLDPNSSQEFVDTDGTKYKITGGITVYNVELTLKINGDEKTYNQGSKKPRKFIFKVDEYGNITPQDSLGKAYIRKPLNYNSHKEDLALAEKIK